MIVFDTEDDSPEVLAAHKSGFLKQVTQIAAITDTGKRFHNNGDPVEFIKWCRQTRQKDVWAFNTSYDIGNLCNTSKIRLYEFDKIMVKGRFISAKYKGLTFYNAQNLSGAGSSVATLGLAVDLPKFGWDYKPDELKKFSDKRLKEFLAYNKTGQEKLNDPVYVFRDCEIVMKFLKFVRGKCADMGIDKIPGTLGSLCVRAFEAGGGENWHEASDESQSALRGARVEIFNQGGAGRIAYTDINSLYPYCMTMDFPACMEKLDTLEGYGICSCDVIVPKTLFIAPLPWRDEEKRLLFPVGNLSGVWTIHELQNSILQGCKIKRINWILGSKEGKPFYRDYIIDKYQQRLDCKTVAESLFWKLLMNNLYGRLAISGEISRTLLLTEENKDDGIPYGTKILTEYQMPLPDFTNYLHASYVLSYARIVLYNFLKMIPRKDLIYCDTDSAFFFCKGELPFSIGNKLGEMKLEGFGKSMIPVLPKTYIFDETYKAKGVPKKHAKDFIDHGLAEYETPFKMRESIRFFDAGNSRKLSVWRTVEKRRQTHYDKKRKRGEFFLPKVINCW